MKKNSIFICLVCFIILNFGLVGCSLFDSSSNSSNSSGSSGSSNTNKISYVQQKIGESFIFETLSIKVNSYEVREYCNGYSAGENNLWIAIYLEIENVGSSSVSVDDYATNIIYSNEKGNTSKFYSSWGSDYGYMQKYKYIQNNSSILPYGKITGMYTYKVPASIITNEMKSGEHSVSLNTNFEFHFMKNSIYRDKEVFIKL